jgi:hypothetical protein
MIQHSVRYPLTVVTDGYDDAIQILFNLHLGFSSSRMEVNVCQTGLHDAEDRKFGFFREPAQFMSYLHFHMQAVALIDSTDIPLDSRVQSAFIQQRRVKQVGKGSEFV